MPTVLCPRTVDDPGNSGRASALRLQLCSLNQEGTAAADAALTTCLMWVAGVLVEIAGDVADPRTAGALVHRASDALAAVPAPAPVPQANGTLPSPQRLTGRELAVLQQLQEEVSLRQIADDLYVSHNTVKSHTRAVYRKLGARSRAEALVRARELGLV
ncbi:LuxR C-terminal-related transcriptional regulator [Streptomyces sp. NBC_00006]|uniref:LuxR C-terminal-related transcriptional regulator n=1 Tax=unclassified Streptomyces TaxID=2593676 RepID=UPI002257F8BA|nr:MULTISPECIES: LuxR C-terminal-related transcriptional regulator [unclassified Streptomyces]MCX4830795.1 LuxR C-terminal-related transcriptional regulator [Streptomyces sp. NBC_01016]MCX5535304.1 LuxR C-terminal-related transcriptional regulator [Streptomyces sp. NBC_00006]